jgi:hypothetical protein
VRVIKDTQSDREREKRYMEGGERKAKRRREIKVLVNTAK